MEQEKTGKTLVDCCRIVWINSEQYKKATNDPSYTRERKFMHTQVHSFIVTTKVKKRSADSIMLHDGKEHVVTMSNIALFMLFTQRILLVPDSWIEITE